MTRNRHTEEQIIAVLKDAHAGVSVQDLCRKYGISDATFDTWRTKCAGLAVNDVKTLRQLEEEHRRLKQMVAEQALDLQALKAITAKPGTAQGETDRRYVDGGTLWAEPRRVCQLIARDRNTLRSRVADQMTRGSGRGCERSPRPSDATAAPGSTCGCVGKGGK